MSSNFTLSHTSTPMATCRWSGVHLLPSRALLQAPAVPACSFGDLRVLMSEWNHWTEREGVLGAQDSRGRAGGWSRREESFTHKGTHLYPRRGSHVVIEEDGLWRSKMRSLEQLRTFDEDFLENQVPWDGGLEGMSSRVLLTCYFQNSLESLCFTSLQMLPLYLDSSFSPALHFLTTSCTSSWCVGGWTHQQPEEHVPVLWAEGTFNDGSWVLRVLRCPDRHRHHREGRSPQCYSLWASLPDDWEEKGKGSRRFSDGKDSGVPKLFKFLLFKLCESVMSYFSLTRAILLSILSPPLPPSLTCVELIQLLVISNLDPPYLPR